MTHESGSVATSRERITEALDESDFDPDAVHDPAYLAAALAAGIEITTLATAHEISKRTLYRRLEEHDLLDTQPPSNGLARTLWLTSPDAVPGES
jgi:hypothetical protein